MSDEAYERYLKLKQLVEELEVGNPTRTSDWYDIEYTRIFSYREHFGCDFTEIAPDNQNPGFRRNLEIVETLVTSLMTTYEQTRWFSLYDYCRLNRLLIWLVEYDGEDIDNLFGLLSLSRESDKGGADTKTGTTSCRCSN